MPANFHDMVTFGNTFSTIVEDTFKFDSKPA